MIVQIGMLFSGMLVGYFFRPKFVDDFCAEDLPESPTTNAMLIQPSNELGALVDSISNANFMKLPVESENAVKVKEPFSMDLCSQSSCAIPSKEKTDGSKAQSKGSKEKTSMKSKGPKDMNLDDLVANTPEVQSPVAVDTQMVTQSHTTFQEFSTSTPAVETPNKKLNAEKAPEGSNKQKKASDVNEKKLSDKDEKKVGSGEKAKKKKGSDKQKQAKVEKPSSGSKDKDSGLKVDTKLGSGSKKNGSGVKSDDIAPATTPQPNQLSDKTRDAKTKGSGEKKLKKKKTKLSKGKKKTRTKDAKKSKTKDGKKKKAKKTKKNKSVNDNANE